MNRLVLGLRKRIKMKKKTDPLVWDGRISVIVRVLHYICIAINGSSAAHAFLQHKWFPMGMNLAACAVFVFLIRLNLKDEREDVMRKLAKLNWEHSIRQKLP